MASDFDKPVTLAGSEQEMMAMGSSGSAPAPHVQAAVQHHMMQQSQVLTEQSKHPTAIVFQVLFKAGALVFFVIGPWVTSNFIILFVSIVLLLAADFWTVKNVTGRLLVGLRWWNDVLEDGTTVWKFESKPAHRAIHPYDSTVFWSSTWITPVVWLVIAIISILSPQKLLISVVALTLNVANVIGYWKCDKDAKNKLKGFLVQGL